MRRFTKAEGYTLVELLIVMAIVGLVAAAVLGVYQVSQDIYIRATALEDAQLGARAGLDRMASELRLIGSYWVGAPRFGASCVPLPNLDAITAATPTSITFMANVDDNSVINGAEATPNPTATGTSVTLSPAAATDAFKVYVANPALNDYIYIANGGTREVKQITAITNSTLTLASALCSSYPVGSLVRDVKIITYTRNAVATSTCPALTCLTRSQGGSGADPVVDNVSGLTFTYYLSDGVTPTTDPPLIREIQIDLTVCVKRTIASSCQDPDSSSRQMTTRVKPRSLP